MARGAVAGLGLTVGTGLLSACGESAGGGEAALSYTTYGGAAGEAQKKAWLDPFVKANPNVRIVQDEPTDYAKIKAQVESGQVTWDVVDVGNDFGLGADARDLLEPIDTKVVPISDFPKEFVGKYRIAHFRYGVNLGFRTDKFGSGKEPQGWADFFDTSRFPGKRGLWKYAAGGILEFALVADGVDPNKLYPLDLERAFKKLDAIRDSIVWWDTGAQSAQLLADGEVSMAHIWNGRAYDVRQEGAPVAVQWKQHFQTADFLVVPKGGQNVEQAMKLVAYITSPKNNARLTNFIPYGPANPKAENRIDASKKRDLTTSYQDEALFFDDQWFAKNFAAVDKEFQRWLRA